MEQRTPPSVPIGYSEQNRSAVDGTRGQSAEPRPQAVNYAQTLNKLTDAAVHPLDRVLADKPPTDGPYGQSIELLKQALGMRTEIHDQSVRDGRYDHAKNQKDRMDDLERSLSLLRCANDNALYQKGK